MLIMVKWMFIISGLLLLISDCFAKISREEFEETIIANGYPKPNNTKIYTYLARATKDYSREEMAMLIAQLMHESIGFQYTEEIACAVDQCAGRYVDEVGLPGKFYYGRGYIQLTWGANYKNASKGLGLGDYLLRNPEVVGKNTKLAVLVSTWYWEARVRPVLEGNKNKFGLTTKAINGGECYEEGSARAKNRWRIYLIVADVLKIEEKAVENGCYN